MGEATTHIHDEEFQKLAERVDVLTRELEEWPDAEVREKGLELLQTVLSLYGEALTSSNPDLPARRSLAS